MIVPGIKFVQGRNDYDDRDGAKFGICIHNTSNDASDEGEALYAARRTDGISSHFYADRDSVTQSIDTADRCGHAGSANANENSIAVEITGANGKSRDWWLANVDWADLGRVLAQVIVHHWPDGSFQVRRASVAEMKANPKVRAFYGHDDCRRAWGGTDHTDPGPNFPWDRLFAAVNAGLNTIKGDDMSEKAETQIHGIWTGTFKGGSSCGQPVKEKYRIPTDGSIESNSVIEQLAEVRGELAETRADLAEVKRLIAATSAVTDDQLDRVLRRVLGSLDGATPAGTGG